jgi:hypothetical protein
MTYQASDIPAHWPTRASTPGAMVDTHLVHRGLVLFLSLAILLATGCGAASSSKSATSDRQQPASPQPAQMTNEPPRTRYSGTRGSGSVVYWGGTDGAPPAPPHELYAVFRRAPGSSDVEVRERARDDAFLGSIGDRSPGGAILGRPIYNDTRLVFGGITEGVYALPTTNSAVCLSAFPKGGGVCGLPGPHGLSVGYDDAFDGLPFRLYGVVGDEVRGVDVVLGGVTRQAELGENGFRFELADAGWGQLHNLVLHLRGGATETVPLKP